MTAHRIVITNGYVLSMDAAIGDIEHGSVLIEGSRIVAVERDLGSVDAEVIDVAGGESDECLRHQVDQVGQRQAGSDFMLGNPDRHDPA